MAETQQASGTPAAVASPGARGFGNGRAMRSGRGTGGRGGPSRGPPRGPPRGGDSREWVPCTKLGRLVKEGRIQSLEEIFMFSMPIKEYQIVDHFIPESRLKDEMMAMYPVQKATSAGQRTRFKAINVVGDCDGHIGIGARVGKEVTLAIRASMIAAKLNIIPIRRGYWGNKIGAPHTIPMKVTGKSGSVSVRLIPAPRGTGIVAAPLATKILQYAGVQDVYTSSCGKTRTTGNFIMATFYALRKTYGFLTPDLWAETEPLHDLYEQHSAHLRATRPAIKA